MTAAPRIAAVLFDLDGTLMDTAGEIHAALGRTFDELGVARLSRKNVESLIGRGIRSLVERALAQRGAKGVDIDEAVDRFERHYDALVGTDAPLYEGSREALELLRAGGVKLGVVTNKARHFTLKLLERAGVDGFFESIVAGDDGITRKPAGEMVAAACAQLGTMPAATLMLGDSDNDVLAARAAGCPVWCVPYGYNEGRPPESLAADRLVASIGEAARLILDPA